MRKEKGRADWLSPFFVLKSLEYKKASALLNSSSPSVHAMGIFNTYPKSLGIVRSNRKPPNKRRGGKGIVEALFSQPCGSDEYGKLAGLSRAMMSLVDLVGVATVKFMYESDHTPTKRQVLDAGNEFNQASVVLVGKLSGLRTMGAYYEAMFTVNELIVPALVNLEKFIGEDLRIDEGLPSEILAKFVAS